MLHAPLALGGAAPQPAGGGGPVLRVGLALLRQVFHGLGRLHVRGPGPALFHHLLELARVLQHGAGAEHVLVKGLAVVIGHEQRGLESLQQRLVIDAGIGVVDKSAGLHVPVGVDVDVPPSPGDAPAHILPVVLEVDGEDGLGAPVGANAAVHLLPLLRRGQQLGDGVVAHGHVVEEPSELGPVRDEGIEKFLGAQGVDVLAGIAAGDAKGQLLALQQPHGFHPGVRRGPPQSPRC